MRACARPSPSCCSSALTSAGKALTAPAPIAGGSGAATVSGYEVSDVRYALSPADPSRIASVSFALHRRGPLCARPARNLRPLVRLLGIRRPRDLRLPAASRSPPQACSRSPPAERSAIPA